MLVKTVLNRLVRFKSFVFGNVFLKELEGEEAVVVEIFPCKGIRPICPDYGRKGPGYDTERSKTSSICPCSGSMVSSSMRPAV